ncbi:Enamine deaminase RidA, house cleaning of reactive enamine intermediates, YjgF/YER057c/UK114 family [Pseudomonas sp. NFACC02]|uniref:RidA family protein n=1 Tax=Pseudomonas TaxID=286 RepID=UPI0007852C28|nr:MULTISPECIES: RidA family protein [Pseudomonas]SER12020.1 Enamine deaminase RidA, house cleaning of reactive enamine intermediates, YjgF/YER057c/UK114 family [Pseudomonas sp. NFACC02]
MNIQRVGIGARLTQAVVHQNTVYLSGQTSQLKEGIEAQTRDILDKIDGLLEVVGSGRHQLLSAQIWLADVEDFAAMNGVWDAWLEGFEPPARACVQARFPNAAYRVEIQVIAALAN